MNESLTMMAGDLSDNSDYLIGPEDLIEVTLFDIEDMSGAPRTVSSRVTNSGYVTLPYVGRVPVVGRTTIQLESELRNQFTRFIHHPEISVFVKEYRSYEIAVLGYVENPGIVQLKGRKTMLEAIGIAGGLNEDAGKTVRVARENENGVATTVIDLDQLIRMGDMALNPVLEPGDVINVPRAGVFYVEGQVMAPGAFPITQEITVTQAIATAGGPDVAVSRERGTTLYRVNEDGTRAAIPIDIASIRAGTVPDIQIIEDDLIVVPLSGPKFVVDRLLGLLRVGVNGAW